MSEFQEAAGLQPERSVTILSNAMAKLSRPASSNVCVLGTILTWNGLLGVGAKRTSKPAARISSTKRKPVQDARGLRGVSRPEMMPAMEKTALCLDILV
jgi:hypothetical protein